MPTRIQYIVTVESDNDFPIDMLRYDHATPFTEQDSGKIQSSFRPKRRATTNSATQTITVAMHREPTVGRWASFGWRVTNVETRRV